MNNEENISQPEPLKTALLAVLGTVSYYAVYVIVATLLILIFALLSVIPIISSLTTWLFAARGDTPTIFTIFISVSVASNVTVKIVNKISTRTATVSLSLKIIGIALTVITGIGLISSMMSGISLTKIIGWIILIGGGIALILKGRS